MGKEGPCTVHMHGMVRLSFRMHFFSCKNCERCQAAISTAAVRAVTKLSAAGELTVADTLTDT